MLDVIALIVSGFAVFIAFGVGFLTTREYQKQVLMQTFLDYNRRYSEIMGRLPQELFFKEYKRLRFVDFCSRLSEEGKVPEEMAASYNTYLWDQITRYYDLCYEQYQLEELGGGWFVKSRWEDMYYTWDKGICVITNSRPLSYVFTRYYGRLEDDRGVDERDRFFARYSHEFVDYMKHLIAAEGELDQGKWDKEKRRLRPEYSNKLLQESAK